MFYSEGEAVVQFEDLISEEANKNRSRMWLCGLVWFCLDLNGKP
jgi:hypothetical protein